jgi:hypothetical protein
MTHLNFFGQGEEIEEQTNTIFLLFVDKTSVLITASNLSELQTKYTYILNYMSTWFAVNGLSLNLKKTNALHFILIIFKVSHFNFFYQVTNIKFLGLWLDKHMEWNFIYVVPCIINLFY